MTNQNTFRTVCASVQINRDLPPPDGREGLQGGNVHWDSRFPRTVLRRDRSESRTPKRRIAKSTVTFVLTVFLCVTACLELHADDRSTTVGLPQTIDQLVLPGSELETIPLEDRNAPFVLQITASYPHGTDHRYDFKYQALEPGAYNITQYLRRVDGSDLGDLPEVLVQVETTLPPGQVLPSSPPPTRIPYLGGYRIAAAVGAFIWVMGLFAFIFVGRKPQNDTQQQTAVEEDPSQKLHALVASARQGNLAEDDRAALERAVIAFWRDQLDLDDLSPAELSTRLRNHEQSGPMLSRLEQWLHAPESDDSIDLNSVLQPIDELLSAHADDAASDERVLEVTPK